jgi:hypothetical protein
VAWWGLRSAGEPHREVRFTRSAREVVGQIYNQTGELRAADSAAGSILGYPIGRSPARSSPGTRRAVETRLPAPGLLQARSSK